MLLLMATTLFAQYRLGQNTGDYAGVNGIQMNPAYILNSKYYLDVQLVGMGVFLTNNYVYLDKENYSLGSLITGKADFIPFETEYGQEQYVNEWANDRLKHSYMNLNVGGPSAMYAYGRHGFGLSTSFKSHVRVKNLPYPLAKYFYESSEYPDFYNVTYEDTKDMYFESFQYGEVAMSYSYNVKARDFDKVDVGVSLKYIIPVNGVKLYADNATYMMPNSDTLIMYNLNGELRTSAPVDFDDNSFDSDGGITRGSGFAVDLGVMYTKTRSMQRKFNRYSRLCRQGFTDYIYRIGFSILDLGFVTFKNGVQIHEYEDAETFWPELNEFEFESLNQSLQEFSYRLLGSQGASLSDATQFTMRMPTSLSFQFDYHHRSSWYLHSSMIYGLPAKAGGFQRPHYLSVMPRYETDRFGVGMPLSVYDFRKPQLGLNSRIAFLTIGTSNILPFLGLANISGADLYLTLKFNLLKGRCGRKSSGACSGQEYGLGGR